MARTGFCDTKPLLDLHKKADERRAPLRTWANASGPIDRWQPVEADESRMNLLKMEPERRWERRLSLQTSEGIIMGFHEDSRAWSPGKLIAEGCVEDPVLLYPCGLQGLPSLQVLVPSLLRHEIEKALEKLDLIWDRTYAWEMFLDMMRTQTQNSLPSADLPRYFTDATQGILVDWLIQVHEMMHFQDETLYLAIHLLNRSLRLIKVTTANLQLLGMVCLFIAAKKEECLLPEVSGLCSLMDHTYTKHQFLRMERKVLSGLKFELSYSPPLHFLLIFASVARCSAMVDGQHFCQDILCALIRKIQCHPIRLFVALGGVDGSLSAGAVAPGGPVCGVSARSARWSRTLFGPPSCAGAYNNRGRGCLVFSLQHSCWQVSNTFIRHK
ncbi:cyclin N-terminal domain-containing protein 2 [Pelmatolapia mariae]|uniref:cyclin N-terminal domain-containing protein 2 n=1 Tax=Pelmatolapia mariae TaxID=158779 RepID=UPI003211D947